MTLLESMERIAGEPEGGGMLAALERVAGPDHIPRRKPEIRRLQPGEFMQNPDGSRSTELSVTVNNPAINQGRPTNIPTIYSVGGRPRRVPEEQAIAHALGTGEKFPSFDSMEQAVAAAEARSDAGGRFADAGPRTLSVEQFEAGLPPPVPEVPSLTRSAVHGIAQGAAGGIAAFPEQFGIGNQAGPRWIYEQFGKMDRGERPSLGMLAGDTARVVEYFHGDEATRQRLRQDIGGEIRPVAEEPAYQLGQRIRESTAEAFPVAPEHEGRFPVALGRGLGSTGTFLLTGLAGRVLRLPALGVVAGTGAVANSAEVFRDAIDRGASFEDAHKASKLAGLVGTSEAVPIVKLLDRLDDATGGQIRRIIIRAGQGGLEEGAQELFQSISENLIASDLVAYDPERRTFQGTGEAAGVGFTVGALFNMLASMLGAKMRRAPSAKDSAAAPGEPAQADLAPGVAQVGVGAALQQRRQEAAPPTEPTTPQPEARPEDVLELTERAEPKDPVEEILELTRRAPRAPVEAPAARPEGVSQEAAPQAEVSTARPDEPVMVRPEPAERFPGKKIPRKRPVRTKPLTLAEFIAAEGGMQDVTGELKAMDAQLWHRGKPFRGRLVRDDGKSPAEMAAILTEAKYLPENEVGRGSATANELYEALSEELAGRNVYSEFDRSEVERRAEQDQAESQRDEAEYRREALRDQAREAGIPEQAIERLDDTALSNAVAYEIEARSTPETADRDAEIVETEADRLIEEARDAFADYEWNDPGDLPVRALGALPEAPGLPGGEAARSEPGPAAAREGEGRPEYAGPRGADQAEVEQVTSGSPEYEAAYQASTAASKKFRKFEEAYRTRMASDEEFLAARAEHEVAQKKFDEAFAAEQKRKPATEAAGPKKSLFASRSVANAADIVDWAREQGFKTTLAPDDMHVTIAHSSAAVAWGAAGKATPAERVEGGKRTIEALGDNGAVVLRFDSPALQTRWQQYRDAGASWDFQGYKPHITITYEGGDVDLSKVEPYAGPILLSSERQEPVDEDAVSKVDEVPTGAAATPSTETTPQGLQAVIPGAERIGNRALIERRMDDVLRAEAEQKPADEGLFDVAGRGQADLVEQAKAPKPAPKQGNLKAAAKLRKTADGLQKQIDAKRNPGIADQNFTPRRARIAEGMRRDADRIEEIQTQLRTLADLQERGEAPTLLAKITSKAQIESLRWRDFPTEAYDTGGPARLKKAGITTGNFDKAKQALEQLSADVVEQQRTERKQGRLKQRIQEIEYGRGIKDFFQTPEAVAQRMVEMADIQPGMEVLEPSAGAGAIARQIREAAPDANLTTVEAAPKLAEILREQDFEVRQEDFLERGGAYDRIIMNPPFSKGQDVAHVRHAYEMLGPGGRLVSIMSPHGFFANDKKSQDFRAWLEERQVTLDDVEGLESGTFEQTGVSSKLVVIDKPDPVTEMHAGVHLPSLQRFWAPAADRIIDSLAEGKYSPFARYLKGYPFKDPTMGGLPERAEYLGKRGVTQGTIYRTNRAAGRLNDALRKAPEADQRAALDYLTTEGADPKTLPPSVRGAAVAAKSSIKKLGKQLVRSGQLSPEAYERHADAYLPRVYLKHLMERTGFGAGLKISDQGYLKERTDLPAEYRDLYLGEIKDVGFLVTKALSQPARDLAMIDFLRDVSRNPNWVLQESLVEWTAPGMTKPRKVTPYWLKAEADFLRRRAAAMPDLEQRARAREIADQMSETAEAGLGLFREAHGRIPKDYREMPDNPRYGDLRGLVVRREVHDDIVGAGGMWVGEKGAYDKTFDKLASFNAWWKMMKVPFNPPTQIRNFVSNGVLLDVSGVPFQKLPILYARAFNQIRKNGKHYRIAVKHGIPASTFTAAELYRIKPDILRVKGEKGGVAGRLYRMAEPLARIAKAPGDLYQFSETWGKTVKIIDAMEREGMSEEQAVAAAQEALFDYSLVPSLVKALRTRPIGAPFITFYYKAFPAVMKGAIRHPGKMAKYYILPYVLGDMLVASLRDVDEEDVDKLRKALPQWLQDQGHVYLFPYKDESGRWAFVNYGYFLPWALHERTMRNAMEVATGEYEGSVNDLMSEVGILGGPVPQIISALMTGVDPWTGREIVKDTDPPREQIYKLMMYAWRMMGPSWLTDQGVLGHMQRSIEGTPNYYGDAPLSPAQAAGRAVGVNIYPTDPVQSRQRNIRRKAFEIERTRRDAKRTLRNKALTPERRGDLRKQYRAQIDRLREDLKRYRAVSQVHPNLR